MDAIARPQDGDGNGTKIVDMGAFERPWMAINRGVKYTRSRYVTISSSFVGATSMRISNDNATWSAWRPYSAAAAWTLTAGDGTKRVYAQYKYAGSRLFKLWDNIILDTTPPSGTLKINNGAASTTSRNVVLNSAVTGATKMRFRNNASATWSTWQTYAATRSWTLTAGAGTKYVVAQYRDAAGNIRQVYDSIALR